MADIEKVLVVDQRIYQSQPKYQVLIGALSNTSFKYSALALTTSSFTFNCFISSQNVFVDRQFNMTATGYMQFSVTIDPANPLADGDPIAVLGRDWSMPAYPLNKLCNTITATINDVQASAVPQDTLEPILRMVDNRKARQLRTTTTALDTYLYYNDAFGCINNPQTAYDSATAFDNLNNGGFAGIKYTDQNGTELAGTFAAPVLVAPAAGVAYQAINGVPCCRAASGTSGTFWIYYKFRSVEPLVLSPFVFDGDSSSSVGFFGLNSLQILCNFGSPARLVRWNNRVKGQVISAAAFNANVSPVWDDVAVDIVTLTPNLALSLPSRSIIPMQIHSRYNPSLNATSIDAGATATLTSGAITLNSIPDYLIVYARPSDYATAAGSVADGMFPLASPMYGNVTNPLTITFDSVAGYLSTYSVERLYDMSCHNGLTMDYNTWLGVAHSAAADNATGVAATSRKRGQGVPLVGGPIVICPARDFGLSTGLAPGIVGNFMLQISMQVRNQYNDNKTAQMVVIAVNSAYLETIRGSSRIMSGVLTESAVIEASKQQPIGASHLNRLIGGAKHFLAARLGGAMGYGAPPAAAAGVSAAGVSAAGVSAAGRARARAPAGSVAARLM